MELTNIPHLVSSPRFFSSCSRCACSGRRTGKAVIAASAAGSGCSADSAFSEPIEQQTVDSLSGPRSSYCYRRRDFASAVLLPFLLPHVEIAVRLTHMMDQLFKRCEECFIQGQSCWHASFVFHDAGTFDIGDKSGGMNGSIIYEVDRPENAGLSKSIKILGKAKEGINHVQQVSWADLIAVAGAEAVALCGGPEIPVKLGRLDSRCNITVKERICLCSTADPAGKLPEETLDAVALKNYSAERAFSTQEMVVLSGAHTIGGKGFGNPNVFDNSYFKVLLEKPQPSSSGMPTMIGLRTDWALTEDDECLRWINMYAEDQAKFFDDFRDTYIKLVNSGVSWRTA